MISVFGGEQVLCREAAQWLAGEGPANSRLTRREIAVLHMVARGAANKEIADLLDIGEKTVRNYVSRLYRKLALRNRADIATYVLQGHIPNEPSPPVTANMGSVTALHLRADR